MLEREKSALEVSLQQTVSEAEVMKGALTTELEATQSRLQQTQVCVQHVRVCGVEVVSEGVWGKVVSEGVWRESGE